MICVAKTDRIHCTICYRPIRKGEILAAQVVNGRIKGYLCLECLGEATANFLAKEKAEKERRTRMTDEKLMEAMEQVRSNGKCNMLDRDCVIPELAELGYVIEDKDYNEVFAHFAAYCQVMR